MTVGGPPARQAQRRPGERRPDIEQVDLLLDAGRGADARRLLEAMIAADPDDVQVLVRLALQRRVSLDPAGAADAIARALAADPEHERVHRVAAILARDRRQLDLARQHARQATRIAPNVSLTWLALAQMELDGRRANPAAALVAAERAVRLAPDSAETRTVLARALSRTGGWSGRRQAGQELREAARLGATSRVAMIKIGEACWKTGRPRAAQQAFSAALRLAPGQPPSLEINRVVRARMILLDLTVLLVALVAASISGGVRPPAGGVLAALGLLVVVAAAITTIGGRRPNPVAALTRRFVLTGTVRRVRNVLLVLALAAGLVALAAGTSAIRPGSAVAAWVLGYGAMLFSTAVVLSRKARARRRAANSPRLR